MKIISINYNNNIRSEIPLKAKIIQKPTNQESYVCTLDDLYTSFCQYIENKSFQYWFDLVRKTTLVL